MDHLPDLPPPSIVFGARLGPRRAAEAQEIVARMEALAREVRALLAQAGPAAPPALADACLAHAERCELLVAIHA
jgi:hypothetical protein